MTKKYQIVYGTAYHIDTKPEVIDHLDRFLKSGERIRLWYGDDKKCWHDEYNVIGRIGLSTGQYKIPLLINNKRCYSGPGISDNCIVRIDVNRNGEKITVYCADNVEFSRFISTDDGLVLTDAGDVYAKCENQKKARRLAAFMNGERWGK